MSSERRLKRGYALERPASEILCGGSEVYALDRITVHMLSS